MEAKMHGVVHVVKQGPLDEEWSLVLPKESLKIWIMNHLETLAKKVKIDGFRSGKIPFTILFQQHGRAVLDEAIRAGIAEVSPSLIQDRPLAASLRYEVTSSLEEVSLESLPDVEVRVFCIFMPEIPEISWKEIVLPDYEVIPSDEDVLAVIAQRAKDSLTSIPLSEDRPAKKGDTLLYTMQYEAGDGTQKEMQGKFRLGSQMLPKELEDTLEGISKGHTLRERLRVPKEFPEKSLAGRKVAFTISFQDIQETVSHRPDDVFAQSKGSPSLEEYKKEVAKDISFGGKDLANIYQQEILENLLRDRLSFPIPETMIERAFQRLWTKNPWPKKEAREEDSSDSSIEKAGDSEREYRTALRKKAEDEVHLQCLVDKIAKEQKVKVRESEIKEYAEAIATSTGDSLDNVTRALYKRPEFTQSIVDNIVKRKVLSWIAQQCSRDPKTISLAEIKNKITIEIS